MTGLSLQQLNLKLHSDAGANFTFEYANAHITDRFYCKNITGLGPPDMDISLPTNFWVPAAYKAKTVVHNRQMVITVGLNPDYSVPETVADLRAQLYQLLGPFTEGAEMYVEMVTSLGTWVADAYVLKVEPNPFDKDPQVDITIGCVGPYFSAPQSVPFPNPPSNIGTWAVNYSGSVPNGVNVALHLRAAATSLHFTNSHPRNQGKFIHVDYPFNAGDTVNINTITNAHTLNRNGSVSLIGFMRGDSNWPQLYPGDQSLQVTGGGLQVDWTSASTTPLFWGL